MSDVDYGIPRASGTEPAAVASPRPGAQSVSGTADLPQVGSLVEGKYLIEAVIGRGAMGAVYRAVHQITGRRVALKWMLADNAEARRRFIREARTMGAIEHPQVVGVFDFGAHEGSVFLVMEYLEGTSLRAHVANRMCTPEEAVRLIMPALEGVAAAHMAGIVHRDLKPENLFVCIDRDGTAYDTRVLDLGIARSLRPKNGLDDQLTRSGVAVGTPRYMAPEQLRGSSAIDQRVDIFALGLVLYEMLAGRPPYEAETYEALVIDIVTGTPPSPRVFNPAIPEALANVVLKALAKEPKDRYPDVAHLAAALEPFGGDVRFRAPRSVHVRQSALPGDPNASSISGSDPAFEHGSRPTEKPTIAQRRAKRARAGSGAGGADRDVDLDSSEGHTPWQEGGLDVGREAGAALGTGPVPLRRTGRWLVVGALIGLVAAMAVFALTHTGADEAANEVAARPARTDDSELRPSDPATVPGPAPAPAPAPNPGDGTSTGRRVGGAVAPALSPTTEAPATDPAPAPAPAAGSAAAPSTVSVAGSTTAGTTVTSARRTSGTTGATTSNGRGASMSTDTTTSTATPTTVSGTAPAMATQTEAHGRAGVLRPGDF